MSKAGIEHQAKVAYTFARRYSVSPPIEWDELEPKIREMWSDLVCSRCGIKMEPNDENLRGVNE